MEDDVCVCVCVCVCALEENSPDGMPERKLSGWGASEESVTAGVELTDRYLYLLVIGQTEHRRIWRCYLWLHLWLTPQIVGQIHSRRHRPRAISNSPFLLSSSRAFDHITRPSSSKLNWWLWMRIAQNNATFEYLQLHHNWAKRVCWWWLRDVVKIYRTREKVDLERKLFPRSGINCQLEPGIFSNFLHSNKSLQWLFAW